LIEMLVAVPGRQDMKGALAAAKAVANERHQRLIFLFWRGEEGTHMPVLAGHRASEWNRRSG
jgi:hypothetical protein